jgi:hypothetical protein
MPVVHFLSNVKVEILKFKKDCNIGVLIFPEDELFALADQTLWIPFSCQTPNTEFEVETLEVKHNDFTRLEFNAIPTIFRLKFTLLKLLLLSNGMDSIKLLTNLWCNQGQSVRKNYLFRIAELIYLTKNVLTDLPNREEVSVSVFEMKYHQMITRIDLLREVLLHEITSINSCISVVPKWKGKSMQFIELISIGIELDLFEGPSQNQICNSLLKAFQVDAESDQPIYKQRFNALFKRSKMQLPLIADYIHRVEEAKKMKIQFTLD